VCRRSAFESSRFPVVPPLAAYMQPADGPSHLQSLRPLRPVAEIAATNERALGQSNEVYSSLYVNLTGRLVLWAEGPVSRLLDCPLASARCKVRRAQKWMSLESSGPPMLSRLMTARSSGGRGQVRGVISRARHTLLPRRWELERRPVNARFFERLRLS
jgi:hypothetical protein